MRLLCAAGDVGGARAVQAVAREAESLGLPVAVLDHGLLGAEARPGWVRIAPSRPPDEALAALGPSGALVFGTSVRDTLALTWARAARKAGWRTLHLLDNWSSYRHRLTYDGGPPFSPDIYAVMDEAAARAAADEGVDPAILRITGQPALADLADAATRALPRRHQRRGDRLRLLIVSEPAAQDQGRDPAAPGYRGYTEDTVLALLCAILAPCADWLTLTLLPHPREDAKALAALWECLRGPLAGEVVAPGRGRDHLLDQDAVVGMASILLYEAWLIGLPVASLQPGLRLAELALLGQRPDVCFITAPDGDPARLRAWIDGCRPNAPLALRPDLARHQGAARACLALCGLPVADRPPG